MKNETTYDTSEPKSFVIALYVITSALIIAILTFAAYHIYKGSVSNRIKKLQNEATMESYELSQIRKMEKKNLETYQWINREKNQIQIPIEKAIQKTIRYYGKK